MASIVLWLVLNNEQIENTMKFREKLKLIRNYLGLTQDQIAEKIGLTSESRRSRVSEWESGISEPKREVLLKYSELAGIDVKKLIDDREILDI